MVRFFATLLFVFVGQWALGQVERDSAFIVLNQKCNACHRDEKPETIFTLENMDDQARKINRQVFIFKLMPKGEEVKLNEDEKQKLKAWIKWAKNKK